MKQPIACIFALISEVKNSIIEMGEIFQCLIFVQLFVHINFHTNHALSIKKSVSFFFRDDGFRFTKTRHIFGWK